MNKKPTQEQIFEMIELATDEIDLLARAFEVIEKACREPTRAEESDLISRPSPSSLLN